MNRREHDIQRDAVRASLLLADSRQDRHNVTPIRKCPRCGYPGGNGYCPRCHGEKQAA